MGNNTGPYTTMKTLLQAINSTDVEAQQLLYKAMANNTLARLISVLRQNLKHPDADLMRQAAEYTAVHAAAEQLANGRARNKWEEPFSVDAMLTHMGSSELSLNAYFLENLAKVSEKSPDELKQEIEAHDKKNKEELRDKLPVLKAQIDKLFAATEPNFLALTSRKDVTQLGIKLLEITSNEERSLLRAAKATRSFRPMIKASKMRGAKDKLVDWVNKRTS